MIDLHPLHSRPLPKGWQVRTVDEIKSPEKHSCVAGPFGSSISSKYFVETGVPVIRGSNLSDALVRFRDAGFVYVTEEQSQKYVAQAVVADDLVFTCWGTIGQVGIIPSNGAHRKYIISNKQLKLRVDPAICDPLYAYFYFGGKGGVEYVKSHAKGAAVPGISLGILKGLRIALPPLLTQQRIASILSAYDDLIENNARRIAILEEMARRLYEEWFVNFRFPGHDGERPGDDLPPGWLRQTVDDVSAYINRGLAPKYDDDAECRVINQKCIRDQRLSMEPARRQSKAVPPEKRVRFGDVLINSTGVGTLGRVAQVYEPLENVTVDSHVSIVRPDASMDADYFGHSLLRLQPFFEDQGVGSTGQTELSRGRIGEAEFIKPPTDLQMRFGQIVRPMRLSCMRLAAKNANLRAQRDLLLPKLISGEIDVSQWDGPELEAAQ